MDNSVGSRILPLSRALCREERSTVTVGFLILTVVLYLCIAAVWNTGTIVDCKIQAQAAADSAALTGASHLASSLNDMVMQNMLALRLHSAGVSYLSCKVASIATLAAAVGVTAYYTARLASDFAAIIVLFWRIPIDTLGLAQGTMDVVRATAWMTKSWKAVKSISSLKNSIGFSDKCSQLSENMGKAIYNATADIEDYVSIGKNKFDLYVTHRKCSYYPKRTSNNNYLFCKDSTNRIPLLLLRFFIFDSQWKTVSSPLSLPDPQNSSLMNIPANIMNVTNIDFFNGFKSSLFGVQTKILAGLSWGTTALTDILVNGSRIPDAYSTDPDAFSSSNRASFQIIAVAKHRYDNEKINNYMANGFFANLCPKNVVAIAAAEAYNPYSELGVLNAINFLTAWHHYSSLGANFQARMTAVSPEVLSSALQVSENSSLAKTLTDNLGYNPQSKGIGNVFLH